MVAGGLNGIFRAPIQASPDLRITLAKSLHGNFLLSVLVRGAGALLALVVNIVLARVLGVAAYGRYMTLYSASILLGALALRGTGQLLTRELSAGAAHNQRWATELYRWIIRHVAIGVLVAAVTFSGWVLMTPIFDAVSGWWQAWLAGVVLIICFSVSTLFACTLNGLGASVRSQSLMPIVNSIVVLLFLAGVLHLFQIPISFKAALWLQVIGYATVCTVGVLWLRRHYSHIDQHHQSAQLQETAFFGSVAWARAARHFFLFSMATVVVDRIDVVLVSRLADNKTAGIYVAGARLAQAAFLVTMAVNTVLYPRISQAWTRRDYITIRRLIRRSMLFTATVSIIEVLIAVLFASYIVKLFGPAYSESAPVFKVMVLAFTLWGIPAPVYAFLMMTGREKTLAIICWIILVVNLAAMFLFVPIMGAEGGAISMCFGYGIVLPMLFVLWWRAQSGSLYNRNE